MDFLIVLEKIIIIMTFLASLMVYFQKPSRLYLNLFPVYIGAVLLYEWFHNGLPHYRENWRLYLGLTDIIEAWFFCFVIRENILNPAMKRGFLIVLYLIPVIGLLGWVFAEKSEFMNVTLLLASLILTIAGIFYFIDLFRDTSRGPLIKQPDFWIISGIFFNSATSLPTGLINRYAINLPEVFMENIGAVFTVITFFTGILFIIGFLCRIKLRQSFS